MMLPNTTAAKRAIDREQSAMKVFRAKCLEHEAAMCYNGPKEIEEARAAVMAAEEAYLDAKQDLFKMSRDFAYRT